MKVVYIKINTHYIHTVHIEKNLKWQTSVCIFFYLPVSCGFKHIVVDCWLFAWTTDVHTEFHDDSEEWKWENPPYISFSESQVHTVMCWCRINRRRRGTRNRLIRWQQWASLTDWPTYKVCLFIGCSFWNIVPTQKPWSTWIFVCQILLTHTIRYDRRV